MNSPQSEFQWFFEIILDTRNMIVCAASEKERGMWMTAVTYAILSTEKQYHIKQKMNHEIEKGILQLYNNALSKIKDDLRYETSGKND